jgi:hypothetical protein
LHSSQWDVLLLTDEKPEPPMSRKWGASSATAFPSGDANAASIACASSNQSSATASYSAGGALGSAITQFTTSRRKPGIFTTSGR